MRTKITFNHHQNTWINLTTEDKDEVRQLYTEYQIDQEVVEYSLDQNERAHLDYDKSAQTLVLIYNVPNRLKIDNHYETIPMTFIVKDRTLITVTNKRNQYLFFEMQNSLEKFPTLTIFEFLFTSLFLISDAYFPLVEEMNRERTKVSNKLKEKATKQNLLALSDLETGIVFFISASKQNVVLLEQLKAHTIYKQLSDSEKEQLDDALIEARQLVEMTKLSSEILRQLSSTYNNVLNNNLNDTMRILTVLSVLLTIPTIISGFFGMNMPLPLENNTSGWLITILISIVLWLGLSFIFRKLIKR
ncbi:magnesium transporter CorA family protein [Enterococcus sp. 669A]|uniref:Magnesium transporter CorA family protein n=1 Tax=Candidatus Enterococcus moelleringii TaxID=2815325 RepID=A0ABS3L6H8_9ENTE|nr:magnesium transporter CorA family protein [Enterococcus sp. 669A]MBO1305212.1 magnesium transporter CorA family protein [Enterococcus sp. 669A]